MSSDTHADVARLAIVVRGSLTEGLGHVPRALAVADALRERGAETYVALIGDDAARHLAEALEAPEVELVSEAQVVDAVEAFAPGVVAFDTVPLTAEVFGCLAHGRPTASLSPVFEHLDRVDRAYSRTDRGDQTGPQPRPEARRWGPDWAVVPSHVEAVGDEDFASAVRRPTLSVGVAMGGADAANRTLAVLEQVREVDHRLLVWVMLGEGYSHSYEQLVESVRRDRRHEVVLARTTSSMWSVLRSCSVLVLAGGTTTYEAAFAGVPSINLVADPARRFLVSELQERGVGWSLDDVTGLPALLDELAGDRDRLLQAHRRCRGVIDGRGVDRIAVDLVALATSS